MPVMDHSGAARAGALPDLILYSRPGCHLCDEARAILAALLEERARDGRPNPPLVERDITANPEWERAFFTTIPVVELGDRRVELATSLARLRALLASQDAAAPAPAPAPAPFPAAR
jgi:glutaredoxin